MICGAKGNDTLNGGKGMDTLLGQKGNDKLKGRGGRDLCIGGKANDPASKVGRPQGRFIPSTEVIVEVETVSGEVVRFDPELPVPFFYAWGYRLARRLGLPVASTLDPEDLNFDLPVPGWVWPGGRGDLDGQRRQRQT
ncbi:MAG TPA: calcium-binding protein [Rubrobacter sp.]|nr:calcium-binding protein [Rubrobacter sp.]